MVVPSHKLLTKEFHGSWCVLFLSLLLLNLKKDNGEYLRGRDTN